MSIELCLIVKNSGEKIINTLKSWKPIIDYWTILDTGSTDNTIEMIKNTLSDIPGQLFEESSSNFKFECFGDITAQKKIIEQFGELPFDFAKARNRSLDLCKKHCDFIISIDDTYIIINPTLLKQKLTKSVDKNYNAFLINIENNYQHGNKVTKQNIIQSLRIIRTKCNYRWVNSIHELIDIGKDTPINVTLDGDIYIYDEVDDYHNNRSNERHKRDIHVITCCYEHTDNPSLKARYAYYAAQTSLILQDMKLAEHWLKCRINMKNIKNQELYCVLLQYTRLTNNRQYAEEAMEMDPSSAEAYYEAARIACSQSLYVVAYSYLRHGVLLCNDNNNNIMFHVTYCDFLKLLIKLALQNGHERDAVKYIQKALIIFPQDEDIKANVDLCKQLNIWESKNVSNEETATEKKYQNIILNTSDTKRIVFLTGPISTGPWDGSSTNVRGSETSLIKIANKLASLSYEVVVFCETPYKDSRVINNVTWYHINNLITYIQSTSIDYMICSRTVQYLQILNKHLDRIRNYSFWLHDADIGNHPLCPSKLAFRKFIFLSEAQKKIFTEQFDLPSQLCHMIPNGIDIEWIKQHEWPSKVSHKFIYSSDANRGLFGLLQIFPSIKHKWPDATLDLYCDLENTDVKCFGEGEYKKKCELNLIAIKAIVQNCDYIKVHGRVSKKELYEGFSKAEFWFYPNTFFETFCITALEAQYFKCKILCPAHGALTEVVKSGIVYGPDITNQDILQMIFDEKTDWKLEQGYEWSLKHSYDIIVNDWISMFKECM